MDAGNPFGSGGAWLVEGMGGKLSAGSSSDASTSPSRPSGTRSIGRLGDWEFVASRFGSNGPR